MSCFTVFSQFRLRIYTFDFAKKKTKNVFCFSSFVNLIRGPFYGCAVFFSSLSRWLLFIINFFFGHLSSTIILCVWKFMNVNGQWMNKITKNTTKIKNISGEKKYNEMNEEWEHELVQWNYDWYPLWIQNAYKNIFMLIQILVQLLCQFRFVQCNATGFLLFVSLQYTFPTLTPIQLFATI